MFILYQVTVKGQVLVIGHNLLNNKPITNTSILVKEGGVITKSVNTKSKTEFIVPLDFGKDYQIYFQNAQCPTMFLEVLTANVPKDKYEYRMQYELNIPFVDRDDEDIDTTVFSKPFHRIIYNGRTRMVDDSAYNNAFARNVLKKPVKETPVEKKLPETVQTPTPVPEAPSLLAGRVLLGSGNQPPVTNKPVSIFNQDGNVIKSTATNRAGAFAFANIRTSEVSRITMNISESETAGNDLNLYNSKNESVQHSKATGTMCEWSLRKDDVARLVDNNYTSNIGGKLVVSSPKQKKFFSERNVYLSNKMHTVLKKTKTTIFGTFVFEDIKPEHVYYIGVDKTDMQPGEKIDLLSKDDNFIATLDTVAAGKNSLRINSSYNKTFNDITISDNEMKMDIAATIFGDNVNTPIGKLKVLLLNDNYEVIDSAITNDFGAFKFKYLPFLKRFYLSAENNGNILDVFKNILIYSSDEHLIKIMTHQKGSKMKYKPVSAEMTRLRDIELDDPWLELLDGKENPAAASEPKKDKMIVENILFETNKYDITPQAKEILDKIILVLNTNKKLKVEIGAHTDSKGSAVSNMKLSQMRAKTVHDYISNAGIERTRIISKGYGESRLLNKCGDNVNCSEMEHAQNRRIEFKILGDSIHENH